MPRHPPIALINLIFISSPSQTPARFNELLFLNFALFLFLADHSTFKILTVAEKRREGNLYPNLGSGSTEVDPFRP